MFKCQIYKEAGHKNKDLEGPDQLRKDVLAQNEILQKRGQKMYRNQKGEFRFCSRLRSSVE